MQLANSNWQLGRWWVGLVGGRVISNWVGDGWAWLVEGQPNDKKAAYQYPFANCKLLIAYGLMLFANHLRHNPPQIRDRRFSRGNGGADVETSGVEKSL